MTESVDLFPTLAELCGLDIPLYLQGVSLAAHVRGENTGQKREVVYAEAGDIK